MNAKKNNPHGRQHEPRGPSPAEEEKTDTEKVAAGEPVAVVGTEVEGTTAAPPASPPPDTVRSVNMPADFDIEASGYSYAQIVDAAIAGHQVNKAYCESIGDMTQVDFGLAPDWQRDSAVQGVVYAIKNDFPSPELMHENWMKVKVENGWTYGLVKDAEAKTHPCLVPYADLPEAQRLKDDHFRDAIMKVLGRTATDGNFKDEDQPEEPRADHLDQRGVPVYQNEFMACLFLALGGDGKQPEIEHLELIPFELAMFYRNEPDAPDAAGLSHLKLKLKTDLLPDEDPRRVELAVKLFHTAITGLDAIDKADGAARQAKEQAAALKPAHNRLEKGEGIYDREPGRMEKSDLGKALDKQRA